MLKCQKFLSSAHLLLKKELNSDDHREKNILCHMQVTIFLLTSVILFSTGFQNLYCLFLGPTCGFLKKLNIELPYDPAIPLLGIYLEKNIIRKDIYTPMFSAALFIIAKTWKQSICPSTDERIKKMWYVYIIE